MTHNRTKETTDDLSRAVLQRIAQQRIVPRPRWQFVVRNMLLWGAAAALTLCGALTVALIVFIVQSDTWAVRSLLGYGVAESLLVMLPLAWIGSGALLAVGAEQALRHTRRGYRYSLGMLLGGIAVASIVGGYGLYRAGLGAAVDQKLHALIPVHETVQMRRQAMFHNPTAGRIMGRVIAVDQPAGLLLVDPPAGDEDDAEMMLVDMRDVPRSQAVGIVPDDEILALGSLQGGVFRGCDVRRLPAYGEGAAAHEARRAYKDLRRELRRSDDVSFSSTDDWEPPRPECPGLPVRP